MKINSNLFSYGSNYSCTLFTGVADGDEFTITMTGDQHGTC